MKKWSSSLLLLFGVFLLIGGAVLLLLGKMEPPMSFYHPVFSLILIGAGAAMRNRPSSE